MTPRDVAERAAAVCAALDCDATPDAAGTAAGLLARPDLAHGWQVAIRASLRSAAAARPGPDGDAYRRALGVER